MEDLAGGGWVSGVEEVGVWVGSLHPFPLCEMVAMSEEKPKIRPEDQQLWDWYQVILWGAPPFLVKHPDAKKLVKQPTKEKHNE